MTPISRRQLLVTSLSVTFSPLLPTTAETQADSPSPTLSAFRALSRTVTGRQELPNEYINRFFPVFSTEQWGPKHIETAWSQISSAVSETDTGPEKIKELLLKSVIRDGEAWFIRHLATTFYTGTYYYQDQAPIDIAGRDALVWTVVADLVTTPGNPDHTYGHWAHPPVTYRNDRQ
eukprot:s1_g2597.t1